MPDPTLPGSQDSSFTSLPQAPGGSNGFIAPGDSPGPQVQNGAFVSNGAVPFTSGPKAIAGGGSTQSTAGVDTNIANAYQASAGNGTTPNSKLGQAVQGQFQQAGNSMTNAAAAIHDTFNTIFGQTQQTLAKANTTPQPQGQQQPFTNQVTVSSPPPIMSDRTQKKNIISAERPVRQFLNALNKGRR